MRLVLNRRVCPVALILAIGFLASCGGATGTGDSGGGEGFGRAGKVRTDFGGDDVANALAIQRDGRIVAAGRTGRAFVLARYRPDGRPDPTFGKGGKVVTDFGAPAGKYAALDGQGAAAVAIQSDAKIVAAGGRGSEFALARYGPDGRLDPTFGRGGKVVTDVGARPGRLYKLVQGGVNGIAIKRDGKIIAAGAGPNDFALVRYKRDGRLDRSFGRGGLALTDFAHVLPAGFLQGMTNPEDYAEAVAVQADGRIVAAGRSDRLYALARYLPDGRLDPTFGRGGEVVNGGGDDYSDVKALAVQPDGKIVAAGGTGPRFPRDVLVRYTRVGRLDPSFH